jgi:adenylyltransferase/sulfurtransferase
VIVAGLGGLGSPALIYLAAAGVGHLTLIDNQRVERSNLNRQVLHWEQDLCQSKVKSAAEKLRLLNSSAKVSGVLEEITPRNVRRLIRGADVVVDGMDNYPTRYLLNEACVKENIPFVHGAVEGLLGQVMTVLPRKGPCLRCAVPREPPKKPIFPVLGATAGVIGCLEAMEVVKLIVGVGSPLIGRMLIFNGADMTFDEIRVKRDPKCKVCGR